MFKCQYVACFLVLFPIILFVFFFLNNSNFRENGNRSSSPILDKFISVFSFSHGTATNTSDGWKYYRNQGMGVEFPYPNYFTLEADSANKGSFKVEYRPKGQNYDFYLYFQKDKSININGIPKCTHRLGEDPNSCLNDFTEGKLGQTPAKFFYYRGNNYIQTDEPEFEFKTMEGLGRFSLNRMYSEFHFL